MKLLRILPVAISLLAAACSGPESEITIDPAKTPLTEKGADALFAIAVVEAPTDGYAKEKLRVHVTPAGGANEVDVVCTLDDADANQKLGKGDTLTCVEGVENSLGTQLAGKASVVEVFAQVDGEEKLVAESTWTPPK